MKLLLVENNKKGKMRLRYITNEKFIAIKIRDTMF